MVNDEQFQELADEAEKGYILSVNYGRAGGILNATKYVRLLKSDPDGYVNMDAYNKQAPFKE